MQCIPLILLNHNLLVLAPDSCGQTVCFGLPILLSCYNQKYHNIIVGLRIIVCSNRESVQSTFNVLKSLNVYNLKIASCVGSLNVKDEFDIVIGTPGRLIDYLTCIKTSLGSLSSLVINRGIFY